MSEEIRELADQLIMMDPRAPGLTEEQRKYRQNETSLIRAKLHRIFQEKD
jgi:hypothetical protein